MRPIKYFITISLAACCMALSSFAQPERPDSVSYGKAMQQAVTDGKNKGRDQLIMYGASGVALLSLLLGVVAIFKANIAERRIEKLREKREIPYGNGYQNISTVGQRYGTNQSLNWDIRNKIDQHGRDIQGINNKMLNLGVEIRNLRIELQDLKAEKSRPVDVNTPPARDAPVVRVGYFPYPSSEGYFDSFISYWADKAMFKAEINGNRASFEPLSLGILKNLDNLRGVDELPDGVSIRRAVEMQVEDPGVAELQSDGFWKITKNAIIRLS